MRVLNHFDAIAMRLLTPIFLLLVNAP